MYDQPYYSSLYNFFNDENSKSVRVFNIEDLTDTKEKFLFHVKQYIQNRKGKERHVEFNNDYSRIRIHVQWSELTSEFIKRFDLELVNNQAIVNTQVHTQTRNALFQ